MKNPKNRYRSVTKELKGYWIVRYAQYKNYCRTLFPQSSVEACKSMLPHFVVYHTEQLVGCKIFSGWRSFTHFKYSDRVGKEKKRDTSRSRRSPINRPARYPDLKPIDFFSLKVRQIWNGFIALTISGTSQNSNHKSNKNCWTDALSNWNARFPFTLR